MNLETSLPFQVKLLRVIQQREIERLEVLNLSRVMCEFLCNNKNLEK
jgi:transcriptional regulator with GAF, ATPase, and Fis domain